MKQILLLFTFMSFASGIFAQVSKTVNLATASTLYSSISFDELSTITNLTLTTLIGGISRFGKFIIYEK